MSKCGFENDPVLLELSALLILFCAVALSFQPPLKRSLNIITYHDSPFPIPPKKIRVVFLSISNHPLVFNLPDKLQTVVFFGPVHPRPVRRMTRNCRSKPSKVDRNSKAKDLLQARGALPVMTGHWSTTPPPLPRTPVLPRNKGFLIAGCLPVEY